MKVIIFYRIPKLFIKYTYRTCGFLGEFLPRLLAANGFQGTIKKNDACTSCYYINEMKHALLNYNYVLFTLFAVHETILVNVLAFG